jgi:hypothetical protein
MNEVKSIKESLILSSIVSLVDRIYDPFSVIFNVKDLSREIITKLIKDIDNIKDTIDIDWQIYGFICYLKLLTLDISSMEQLGKSVNLSENFKQIFKTGLSEIEEEIKKYLNQNIEIAAFLFFDESSETVQIRSVSDWQETKKFMESKLFNLREEKKYQQNDLEQMLTENLRIMYKYAPAGYQMSMVHLFGIKYNNLLNKVDLSKIAKAATGKNSLYVEIGKGKKLSKFVKTLINLPSINVNFHKEKIEVIDATADIFFFINQKQGNLTASGRYLESGFLVLKGSKIRIQRNYPSILKNVEVLIQKGILKMIENDWIFCQDYLFSTPSGAACVITGINTNGWIAWKDNTGRPLMEFFKSRTIAKKTR